MASLNREGVAVRSYRDGDEVSVARVFSSSVKEVARLDYSDVQVDAWSQRQPSIDDFRTQATDGRLFLVATVGDDATSAADSSRIVGYIDLEADGHIDHLYCAPEAAGRGIGSLLYEAVEAHAQAERYPRLYVEAGEAARRLFERQGFTVDHRNDLDLDGVALHNYSMSKQLD